MRPSHPYRLRRADTAAARGRVREVDTSMPDWRETAVDAVAMLVGAGRRALARELIMRVDHASHLISRSA